jgi:MFS family permease
VQALHGVTVVGLNLGSPLYLDVVAPEKLRSTAQGILSMVGVGIAGIASNASAGWLMDQSGIDRVYFICGLGALTLGVLACWILPYARQRSQDAEEIVLPSDPIVHPRIESGAGSPQQFLRERKEVEAIPKRSNRDDC